MIPQIRKNINGGWNNEKKNGDGIPVGGRAGMHAHRRESGHEGRGFRDWNGGEH